MSKLAIFHVYLYFDTYYILCVLLPLLCFYLFCLPLWGTLDAEIEHPSVTTRGSKILPLKSGAGQNIAMHASPTDRDFFLQLINFKKKKIIPRSISSADSFTVSVHPRVQSYAFTSVRTLKIL